MVIKVTGERMGKMILMSVVLLSAMQVAQGAAKTASSLACDGGVALSDLLPGAQQITFTEKGDSTKAKLDGMDECKGNKGKYFCYHANSETMINIPLDIGSKHQGDKVVIFINDDADDVTGNGKSISCTVR
jgi:hypothetical protein